jgi:hypothetical protein
MRFSVHSLLATVVTLGMVAVAAGCGDAPPSSWTYPTEHTRGAPVVPSQGAEEEPKEGPWPIPGPDAGNEGEDDAGAADATVEANEPDAEPPDAPVVEPPPEPPPVPVGDFCEVGGSVVMEAEGFSAQTGYATVARGDASGGAAMQVGASGALHFEIWLDTGGTWYFWPRTLAPDAESNGMYVDLDGVTIRAPATSAYPGVADIYVQKSGSTWYWEPKWQGPASGQVEGPVTFEASAGAHVLTIRKRKMERPLIDKIVLTKGNAPPAGLGPAETRCP